MKILLLLGVIVCFVAVERASTQTRNPADGPWAGWVRCEITAEGAGYSDHQTHTWALTGGAPRVEGVFRIYPATWTVVGGGSLGRTQATNVTAEWATNGQAPSAPIAVSTRGDGHLVFALRHDQLRAPNGFTGYRFYTTDGKDQPRQAIAAETYEYRFQPIDGAPANGITGSSTLPIPSSNAFAPTPQPGSTASAACTWQFVQSPTPIAPPSTSSAAATGTSAPQVTLSAAGAGTIQRAPDQTATDTTTRRRDQTLSANARSALPTLVASAPTVDVTITPAGEITGAFSGPTRLTPGAQGTFQLTLTAPGSFTRTVTLPPPPPTQISQYSYSTAQTTSTSTSTTALDVNLTFDSNEGETTTGSVSSGSNVVAPSATFTFQTAGTYSVSVGGTVAVQTRVETVYTTTTTVMAAAGVGCATQSGTCYTPISVSTTTKAIPAQISVKLYQVSARSQLTVAAQ